VEFGMHYGTGSSYYLGGGPQALDTNWHHFALVYNTTVDSFTFYHNGFLYSGMRTSQHPSLRFPFFCLGIGTENGTISYPTHRFKGYLDEVFYYHSALSASELQFLLNNYKLNSGLSSISNQSFYAIYPNPASDQINIQADRLNGTPDGIMELTNAFGQLIYSGKTTGNTTEISTHDIPNGVYFLRVEDKSLSRSFTQKIIICH
jgi:hypothetical protein